MSYIDGLEDEKAIEQIEKEKEEKKEAAEDTAGNVLGMVAPETKPLTWALDKAEDVLTKDNGSSIWDTIIKGV